MRKICHHLIVGALLVLAAPAAIALDSRDYIDRAVELIEAGEHGLARVYLEPALIDYRLTPGERSRAYYVRGYSFFSDGLYASAAKDYHHALEFNPGNPAVLAAVAQLHLEGLGVRRNATLAVELFRQAAEAGLAEGMIRMGFLHLQGVGVDQDIEAARRWFAEAVEQGSAIAMVQMAQTFRAPWATTPAADEALRWLVRAHEAGAPDALAYAGFMTEAGELGEPDLALARARFEASAAAGSALAQAKLAHMHLIGHGAEIDAAKAMAYFRQAAAQDYPPGYMGIAYLYESGTGVAADLEEAGRWYARAATAGLVDAQLRMAYMALRRDSLEGQQEAVTWLARAAGQSSTQALNDYAWLLATSRFAEVRDGARALNLAQRAVDRARNPSYLDTLAAAYAELGQFEQALQTQREALAAAPADAADLYAELSAHLEAFESGRPWRE
jgi:TPR repeat protein